jgi:CHAT domain-containing protein
LVLAAPDFESQASRQTAATGEFETRHLRSLGWTPLPGTRTEAERIGRHFDTAGIKARTHLGSEATKTTLLNARSPRFLHVATHGFFLDDPSLGFNADPFVRMAEFRAGQEVKVANPLLCSGLALAGSNCDNGIRAGLVTAYEMKAMNLWGTELVTLSACETGLGGTTTGGGVRGLRQVLLQAGARRVVSSLWRIPDRETADLMEAFYRHLLAGQPSASALRKAMLEVRAARLDGNPDAHPFFWGGFILIGDPGPVAIGAVKGE